MKMSTNVIDKTQINELNSLSSKSIEKYEKEFQQFNEWRKQKCRMGEEINEELLLNYLDDVSKTYKASSTRVKYFMLKSTLKQHKNIDTTRFSKINDFLQVNGCRYKPKESKILERYQIEEFLINAPDNPYLMMKVAVLLGIYGACGCEELTYLTIDNIQDKGSYLYIAIPNTKNNKTRTFKVTGKDFSINILQIYRKYVSLRPHNVFHRRFFLNYKRGICTVQPVGINTMSKIPRSIALFLRLPEAEAYTGHCFRRSAYCLTKRKISNSQRQDVNEIKPQIQRVIKPNNNSKPINLESNQSVHDRDNFSIFESFTPVVQAREIPQISNSMDGISDNTNDSQQFDIEVEEDCEASMQNCYICLKPSGFLFNLYEMDGIGIKVLTKLQTCIPEIDWQVDYLICPECSTQIDNLYNFRELCIKSYYSQKNDENPVVHEVKQEILDEEPIQLEGPTIDQFIPIHCNDSFYSKNNLIEYNDKKHLMQQQENTEVNSESLILVINKEDSSDDEDFCDETLQSINCTKLYVRNNQKINKKKIQCQLCGQKYVRVGDLKKHQSKVHSGDKKCVCMTCGSAFLTKLSLKHHHQLQHNNEPDYMLKRSKAYNKHFQLSKTLKMEYESTKSQLNNHIIDY